MKLILRKGNSILLILLCEKEFPIQTECSVLYVTELDWNNDLSPWYANKVFRKGSDFAGNGPQLLTMLTENETVKSVEYKHRIIGGYSLAGLFALYACGQTDLFDGCICCSASFWYPRFTEYIKEKQLSLKALYLSLGNKEKNSRNKVLASVENCTWEVYEQMKDSCNCIFEMNEGTHFDDPVGRLQKGITWMESRV